MYTVLRAEGVVDVPPHENGRAVVNRQAAQRVDNPDLRLQPHRSENRAQIIAGGSTKRVPSSCDGFSLWCVDGTCPVCFISSSRCFCVLLCLLPCAMVLLTARCGRCHAARQLDILKKARALCGGTTNMRRVPPPTSANSQALQISEAFRLLPHNGFLTTST